MRLRIGCAALVSSLLLGTAVITSAPAGATTITLPQVVSAVPQAGTPSVDDGTVLTFAQVGSTMVAGGSFTSVAGQPRRGVFAFDASSGAIATGFSPVLDGSVNAVWPGLAAGTVYVAGSFNTVNGATNKSLVLLNLATGTRVSSFVPIAMNGVVNTVKLVGTHLYVGGSFTSIGGQARGGLASLNPTTGAVDGSVQNRFLTNHNWTATNNAAKAAVGITDLDVTPDGATMVVIGNFKTADTLPRDQVAVLNLTGAQSVVRTDWRARGYEPACFSWAYDSYVRDLDISPDGSWFAISSTGGGNTTLCDTVARFPIAVTGDDVQPTWRSVSGGDSLLSVAIAGSVVYAGGHQRWMNNPNSSDRPGTGSVPRPGLVALDARNGTPIKWNPGRNPRGSGAWATYVTSSGLWVGSDTDWIGDRRYRRYKLAFFPLAGGSALANETPQSLPAGIYQGGVGRRDFTGTTASAAAGFDIPLSTTTTRGSVLIGQQLFYGSSDGLFYVRSFNGTTFGPETLVDPYLDPAWSSVDTGSGQTFQGQRPSFYPELVNATSMFYADGNLYYTLSGQTGLYYRAFSPDSGIVAANRSQVAGVTMPAVSGAFLAGGQLYYVTAADGRLTSVGFSGGTLTGTPTVLTGAGVGTVDWRGQVLFLGPAAPANQLPTAIAAASCSALSCAFQSAGSSDPDGTLASYSWNFGDGTTSTEASPTHDYTAAGSFTATLTVTDNAGGTGSATVAVSPAPLPATPVAFRAVAAVNKVSAAPAVAVPAAVQAGDQLLLVATSGTATTQSAPAGWTQVAQQASTVVTTTIWQRTATAADVSSTVTVALTASTKVDVHLLAYAGAGPVSVVTTAGAGSGTVHTAPSAAVATSGSWVLRYWADKSSTTTSWVGPADVTVRDTLFGTGAGYISTLIADSGTAVPTGTTGTSVATTGTPSSRDLTATIVLPPKG